MKIFLELYVRFIAQIILHNRIFDEIITSAINRK